MSGYSALRFQDGVYQDKVTAPPTVPTKRAEELTGDEADTGSHSWACTCLQGFSSKFDADENQYKKKEKVIDR